MSSLSELRAIANGDNLNESVEIAMAIGIVVLANELTRILLNPKTSDDKKATAKKDQKTNSSDNDTFTKACKSGYGIELKEKEPGLYKNEAELTNAIITDMSAWLPKIKSSKACKATISAFLTADDEESIALREYIEKEEITSKLTQSYINSCIFSKPKKWDNHNTELMYIDNNKAGQELTGSLYWVGHDLTRMLEITYAHYITGVSAGDGDEGIVYFTIKKTAFKGVDS